MDDTVTWQHGSMAGKASWRALASSSVDAAASAPTCSAILAVSARASFVGAA